MNIYDNCRVANDEFKKLVDEYMCVEYARGNFGIDDNYTYWIMTETRELITIQYIGGACVFTVSVMLMSGDWVIKDLPITNQHGIRGVIELVAKLINDYIEY